LSATKRSLEVLVYDRSGFVGSLVFTTPKISLGRHPEAMVRLDDPAVSLKHAELSLEGGLFRVKDLGSRTGTRINGAPVRPRQPLEPTDEILIGPFRLRATVVEPEPEPLEEETLSRPGRPPLESVPTAEPFAPMGAAFWKPRKEASAPPPPAPEPPSEVTRVNHSAPAAMAPPVHRPPVHQPPLHQETVREIVPASFAAPVAAAPAAAPEGDDEEELRSLLSTQAAPVPFVHVGTVPLAFAVFEAPAVAEDHRVDDDDDDDDDSDFVPPFDLLAALSRGGQQDDPAARGRGVSLEVIKYRADRVLSVDHPRAKGRLRLPGSKAVIGTFEDGGALSLYPDACREFSVREDGHPLPPAEVLARSDGAKMPLTAGMQVGIDLEGEDKILVHWVPRVQELPVPKMLVRPSREHTRTGAGSLAVHVAVLLFIGVVLLRDKKADLDINAGRFATIKTQELELEPPPPAPTPEALDAARTPQRRPTKQDPTNKSTQPPLKGAQPTAQDAPASTTQSPSAAKILSALGGAPTTAGAISVTNLDALPMGAGDFKVSGTVGKAPGDTLRIGAVGTSGSDPDTKSANELGANNIGKVQAQVGTAVRARVTAAPAGIRGEGTLDRGAIQKVVNAHLYQVQGCYERQLAKDPSLSGKIFFDWVVGLTGGVVSVRVGRSTIHSVETTTCIQSAIQGWKFPAPQGGTVTVTYPFAFSSLGG